MFETSEVWTEEHLLKLIEFGAQESLRLDYKRSEALQKSEVKKNEISKDVSAFANSAGGTIVYGIVEDGHVPTNIDAGIDPDEISKEWLEQVINSRIQRRISGVVVTQITLTQRAGARVAYVVHVPASHHAPHQANDKRFYKRFNFESVPMEEYEVRDVANRATSPDLSIEFMFGDAQEQVSLVADGAFYEPIELTAVVQNHSEQIAEYAVFDLFLDSRIQIVRRPGAARQHRQGAMLGMDHGQQELVRLTVLWDGAKGMPLFNGVTIHIPSEPIQIALPCNETTLALRYLIGSPRMKTRDEYRFISIENGVAKFHRSYRHESPGRRVTIGESRKQSVQTLASTDLSQAVTSKVDTVGGLILEDGHRGDNQAPLNGHQRVAMLVMILWRKRLVIGNADLVATSFASENSRVRCLLSRLVKCVERLVRLLRQVFGVLVQGHGFPPLCSGGAGTLASAECAKPYLD